MRLVQSSKSKSNYTHSVVSLTSLGKVGELLQSQGVEVMVLGMSSIINIPIVFWRLVCIIRSKKPDIIQTWMYHADLLGGLAAFMSGNRPVIWGIRTTDVKAGGSRLTSIVRRICALLSTKVPHTIICAADASRKAHILVGYDQSRMVVVPNGFDLSQLNSTDAQRNALRSHCGFTDSHVVVGFVGRFHPEKDQRSFIKAAGLLATQYPHVRFVMIGRDLNRNNAQLSEWINDAGCRDLIVLMGERGDVPVCLSAMDLFCLSSRTEGFPNALGEAMAMGLPCVTTDVGDAAMLIQATGVIVRKEDSHALAVGLGKLLDISQFERKQLGAKAKKRIYEEFSMDLALAKFENIYDQILRRDKF
ncbi:RfaG Glycosyltransferase [Burkholderiaceae bacterium]